MNEILFGVLKEEYLNFIKKFDSHIICSKSGKSVPGLILNLDNINLEELRAKYSMMALELKYNDSEKLANYLKDKYSIDKLLYFIPLSSPKPKYKTIHNNRHIMKIDDGRLGVINIGNIVPVPIKARMLFEDNNYKIKIIAPYAILNFSSEYPILKQQIEYSNSNLYYNKSVIEIKNEKYRKLLEQQFRWIKAHKYQIIKKAKHYYTISYDTYFHGKNNIPLNTDLKLLYQLCKKYNIEDENFTPAIDLRECIMQSRILKRINSAISKNNNFI